MQGAHWVKTIDERGVSFYYHTQRHEAAWTIPATGTEAAAAAAAAAAPAAAAATAAAAAAVATPATAEEHAQGRLLEAVLERLDPGTQAHGARNNGHESASWLPSREFAGSAVAADAAERGLALASGEAYRSTVSFNQAGKFDSADAGGYFERKGIASDKAGRQLSSFFDLEQLGQNREHAASKREKLRQRKDINWRELKRQKQSEKQRRQNEWMRGE